jgi:hypothetical protein
MSSPSPLYRFLKREMKKMFAYRKIATFLLVSSMIALSITFLNEKMKVLTIPIYIRLRFEFELSLSS